MFGRHGHRSYILRLAILTLSLFRAPHFLPLKFRACGVLAVFNFHFIIDALRLLPALICSFPADLSTTPSDRTDAAINHGESESVGFSVTQNQTGEPITAASPLQITQAFLKLTDCLENSPGEFY